MKQFLMYSVQNVYIFYILVMIFYGFFMGKIFKAQMFVSVDFGSDFVNYHFLAN